MRRFEMKRAFALVVLLLMALPGLAGGRKIFYMAKKPTGRPLKTCLKIKKAAVSDRKA